MWRPLHGVLGRKLLQLKYKIIGKEYMDNVKKPKIETFSKLIVFMVMLHGMVMSTLSYVLAAFGNNPVESVSVAIVTEVIAPVTVYLATKTIQNIFEYNKLSFSTPLKEIQKDIKTPHIVSDLEIENPVEESNGPD